MEPTQLPESSFRRRMYRIIFEADTPWGKTFDVALIIAIALSVLAVMMESVEAVRVSHAWWLLTVEWVLTILFSIEYTLRLSCVKSSSRYALSFFGIIDLLAILPTFIAVLFPGAQALLVVRVLRILRVFRVLKLVKYVEESEVLTRALWASRRKITVFLFAVFTIVVILGSLMYLIEGPERGFTSIPQGVYWAVVTLTTVGYGDLVPYTIVGRMLATCVMVMGFGIIAVPTGIVTGEIIQQVRPRGKNCPQCGFDRNPDNSQFCSQCGVRQ